MQPESRIGDHPLVRFHCCFDNGTAVRHCLILNNCDANFVLSGDVMGDLNVWNVAEKRLQYQVPDPMADEMFRLSVSVTAMAQSAHFLAVRFMNRGIDVFSTSDPGTGLTRLNSIQSELLIHHGKGLLMTDTEIYASHAGGLFVAELY